MSTKGFWPAQGIEPPPTQFEEPPSFRPSLAPLTFRFRLVQKKGNILKRSWMRFLIYKELRGPQFLLLTSARREYLQFAPGLWTWTLSVNFVNLNMLNIINIVNKVSMANVLWREIPVYHEPVKCFKIVLMTYDKNPPCDNLRNLRNPCSSLHPVVRDNFKSGCGGGRFFLKSLLLV